MKQTFIRLMLAAIVFTGMSTTAFAAKVNGKTVDGENNEPLPFCTLRISEAANSQKVINAFASDENGAFSFEMPAGNYILKAEYTGYKPVTVNFTSQETGDVTLNDIILRPDSEMLDEVVIQVQKPLVKVESGKVVYDMHEDPSSGNETVIGMLRKVPMVTVDGDDNIKVNGQSNFKIYLNGRENPMMSQNAKDVLKALPASSVSKIEVITEPGAKYDAEGVGGILNIVMQQAKETPGGSTATLNLNFSRQGINGGVFAMAKRDKVTANVQYNYSANLFDIPSYLTNTTDYKGDGNLKSQILKTDMVSRFHSHMGNVSMSYEANKDNLFNASVQLFSVGVSIPGTTLDTYGIGTGRTQLWSYKSKMIADIDMTNVTANAAYQHNFKRDDNNLVVSYQYTDNHNKQNFRQWYYDVNGAYQTPDNNRNLTAAPGATHIAQADYTNVFTPDHKIETGVKGTFVRSHNNSEYSLIDGDKFIEIPDESVNTKQTQDILAAYGAYTFTHGGLTAKGGVRYEHTRMTLEYTGRDAYKSNLNDVVPDVAVSYNFSPVSALRLGYNMRISRPDVNQMSPYENTSLPLYVSVGNPHLSSEHNHTINLNYSIFAGPVGANVTLALSQSNNLIGQLASLKDGVIYQTFDNLGRRQMASLSAYISYRFNSKLNASVNLTGDFSDYSFKANNLKNSGWHGNGNLNLTYTMPADIKLNVYGGLSTQTINLQGHYGSYHYYGLSFSRSFLPDNRLNLSVSASSFFEGRVKWTSMTETPDYISRMENSNSRWNIGLAVRYTIGSLKARVKTVAKAIEEEQTQKPSTSIFGGM